MDATADAGKLCQHRQQPRKVVVADESFDTAAHGRFQCAIESKIIAQKSNRSPFSKASNHESMLEF